MAFAKKRAVFLVGYYPYASGGAEYQALLLAEALKHEMDIEFLFESPGFAIPGRVNNSYGLTALKSRPLLYRLCGPTGFTNAVELQTRLREIRPDVIYQRDAGAYTGIAAKYAKASGCKLIWHIASECDLQPLAFSFRRSLLFSWIDKKILEYGIRHADYVVGQAHYQDQLLRTRYNRRCDLIVPNFHPAPTERISKDGPLTVIWVANLKQVKRPDLFIQLAKVLEGMTEVRFVMVGQPANPRYQRRINDMLAGTPNVEYLGGRAMGEVNELFARAHVLVNTSEREGFPNTFIQAWMRRAPVVSLHVDPDGVLEKERVGVHARSMPALIDAVEDLLNDPHHRETIGQRAREYALRHHSVQTALPPLLELFRTAVDCGEGTGREPAVA